MGQFPKNLIYQKPKKLFWVSRNIKFKRFLEISFQIKINTIVYINKLESITKNCRKTFEKINLKCSKVPFFVTKSINF